MLQEQASVATDRRFVPEYAIWCDAYVRDGIIDILVNPTKRTNGLCHHCFSPDTIHHRKIFVEMHQRSQSIHLEHANVGHTRAPQPPHDVSSASTCIYYAFKNS